MQVDKEIIIAQIPTEEYIAKFRNEAKFIEFCKKCKNYNTSWSCPPFTTNYTACISKFSLTNIIGIKINIDQPTRQKAKSTEERNTLIREIFGSVRKEVDSELLKLEAEVQPSLLFYAGSCIICYPNKCSRTDGKPCRFPSKMRSTLEAIGFDMGRTNSELLGIELKWCNDNELPPYFTLIYGLLTNSPVKDQVKTLLDK